MRRRNRGNVLVTALFICIFLYLLSAALVSMHRQDMKYSIASTHRMQAELAAAAGSNYVLQTMKADPKYPSHQRGTVLDATWDGTVTDVDDPSDLHYLKQLQVAGQDATVTASHDVVLEEIKMAPTLPAGQEAIVFAYTTAPARLVMMGASFAWQVLGAPPGPNGLPNWLVANQGPLFTQTGPGTGQSSPHIYDWTPYRDANNIAWPGAVQLNTTPEQQTMQDEHVVYLTFDKSAAAWNDVPDPDLKLGHTRPILIGGEPNGQPQYASVVVNKRTITYVSSEFKGPKLDWFGLRGQGMAASGTMVVSQAVHYCYIGWHLQNHVSVVKGVLVSAPTWQPPQFLVRPAVLGLDVAKGQWTVLVDCMPIADANAAPAPYSGPLPNVNSLGYVNSQVYAFSNQDSNAILLGERDGWTANTTIQGVSLGLYDSGGGLAVHHPDGTSDDGLPQVSLGGLTPEAQLAYEQPSMRGVQLDATTHTQLLPRLARPALSLHASLLADVSATSSFATLTRGANSVATLGSEVYSWTRFRRHWIKEEGSYMPPYDQSDMEWTPVDTLGLCHYDGQGWQLWPGGIDQQVDADAPPGTNVIPVSIGGESLLLDPNYLGVALYSGSTPVRRRYVPVPGQP